MSKQLRSRLRDLASIAYERELSRELGELENDFRRWRGGEINAFDLSEAIHRFHQDEARDLFSKYAPSNLEVVVAGAIQSGIISKSEAGRDVLDCLAEYLTTLGNRP